MTAPQSARQALRTGTGAHHERVDAAFGRYDLSDLAQYRDFLSAQARGFLPAEAGLDRSSVAALLPDWPERRRSHLLAADLAALGVAPPGAGAMAFDTPEEALGAVYVLEGSRLGGAMLARTVPEHFPLRFLTPAAPQRWRALIELLDRSLVSDEQRAAAIGAACRVFALFEGGARRKAS